MPPAERRWSRRRRTLEVVAERPRWSLCYAPHGSMYFDQLGKVRACCQNTGVYLGDVTTQTLQEIWNSADAERMRGALENNDLTEGCDFCAWQLAEGNDEIFFGHSFDHLEPESRRPKWPSQMEFSLTNTCNLQCAMCNGDWSSTIRAKREGREPLKSSYSDRFYEQLAEFLPHLRYARFLGGEPFLGAEPMRVMEMLAALETPPTVNITTNGTIYTKRVRDVIDRLRPEIVVSIDAASTDTYDSIRVGAHLPNVLANLDRFISAVGNSKVSIAHCLMTSNWHEFADLLVLAEERDLAVGVNVVRFPAEYSLYQLQAGRLRAIVDELDRTDVALTGARAAAWRSQRAALRHRLHALETSPDQSALSLNFPEAAILGHGRDLDDDDDEFPMPFAAHIPSARTAATLSPNHPLIEFTVTPEGDIGELSSAANLEPIAVLKDLVVDRRAIDLIRSIENYYGPSGNWAVLDRPSVDNGERFRIRPQTPDLAQQAGFTVCGVPHRDERGQLVAGRFWIETVDESTP